MVFNKVKTIVSERNGVELEYNEETNPLFDLLLTPGLALPDILIIEGSDNPSLVGIEAPLGSYYIKDSDTIYKKILTDDTGWAVVLSGAYWVLLHDAWLENFKQYVIHNRPLIIFSTLYLGTGSDVILL